MLESLFNKVAGPEACFPENFAKCFYRIAPVAATYYSGLYNFASNSNGRILCQGELPRIFYKFS